MARQYDHVRGFTTIDQLFSSRCSLGERKGVQYAAPCVHYRVRSFVRTYVTLRTRILRERNGYPKFSPLAYQPQMPSIDVEDETETQRTRDLRAAIIMIIIYENCIPRRPLSPCSFLEQSASSSNTRISFPGELKIDSSERIREFGEEAATGS